MYEGRDEAICALTPDSEKSEQAAPADLLSSPFRQMTVLHSASLTHVRLNGETRPADDRVDDLRDDLSTLADMLDISSKVLLDFGDVESFSSACINELALFDRRLRHRGSRIVLCALTPATRACFFPAR